MRRSPRVLIYLTFLPYVAIGLVVGWATGGLVGAVVGAASAFGFVAFAGWRPFRLSRKMQRPSSRPDVPAILRRNRRDLVVVPFVLVAATAVSLGLVYAGLSARIVFWFMPVAFTIACWAWAEHRAQEMRGATAEDRALFAKLEDRKWVRRGPWIAVGVPGFFVFFIVLLLIER